MMMPTVRDVVSKYKEGSGMRKGVACYRKETQRDGNKMGLIFSGRKCGGVRMMQVCIKNRSYCGLRSDVISEMIE